MISFSFTEVQRLRIYGGFGDLDDPRRPCDAPSDRRCIAGIFSYPSDFEQEKATIHDYTEKCFQGLWDNSAGMAIHPRSAIHCVSLTCDSESLFLISFCNQMICAAQGTGILTYGTLVDIRHSSTRRLKA